MTHPYDERSSKQITLSEKVGSSGGKNKRLSVTLTQELLEHLQNEADSEGISLAKAIRRAIARDDYIQKKLADGGRLFLLTKDGKSAELRP